MQTIRERKDPDALLQQAFASEVDRARGRLKIFLGYASGVGKSARMLDEGRRRRERGQDVVIGAPQLGLATNPCLPVIPVLEIDGRPVIDVPTILARQPAVCLIDGLAFTNPPGSPHPHRWQDVETLLNHGISVLASVNIQFIAELQGQVAEITGKCALESVPRSFINGAEEIVVVDASAESCVTRAAELDVDPEIVEQRLSALRELALLLAADVVEYQLETYLRCNGLTSQFATQERILLCLSPAFDASDMIGSAKRSAERFHGDLAAVYVSDKRLNAAEEQQLQSNISLARIAGAQVHVLEEEDAIESIVTWARARGVTQLFVGHSSHRNWWNRLGGSSLDRLLRCADGIDVKIFPH